MPKSFVHGKQPNWIEHKGKKQQGETPTEKKPLWTPHVNQQHLEGKQRAASAVV